MNNGSQLTLIGVDELKRLKQSYAELNALIARGVKDWAEYDNAMNDLKKRGKKNDN